MKDILNLTINGVPIGETPEFLKKKMTDEDFREFNKFPSDDHEDSIDEVVRFLKNKESYNMNWIKIKNKLPIILDQSEIYSDVGYIGDDKELYMWARLNSGDVILAYCTTNKGCVQNEPWFEIRNIEDYSDSVSINDIDEYIIIERPK